MRSPSSHLLHIALASCVVVAAAFGWVRLKFSRPAPPESSRSLQRERDARLSNFNAEIKAIDETVWAKEILAEKCGEIFDSFWNSVNAATNKLGVARALAAGEIILGNWNHARKVPHGISERTSTGRGRALNTRDWRQFVDEFERLGWQLAQIEIRHNQFETDDAGRPRESRFYFSAHLSNPALLDRAILEGDLIVTYESTNAIQRIDASGLTVKMRHGEPAFRLLFTEAIQPPANSTYIDPLILYDLDGDGLSEIVLAAKNRVYRRQGSGRYVAEALCRHPPGPITTAIIADFDGDGAADFLCAKAEGLFLFKGSSGGTFEEPARLVWTDVSRLQNAMVLTCGDIDHDGDLDLFLGQYKVPTLGQILRPNFYDANDSHPSFLLLNDGRGNFTDATAKSGLAEKRNRRVFSASFVDLNRDGHLDLLVVSDFAGVDLYRNDGHGRFTDATRDWVPDRHGFGMGHAMADFDGDGRLDFLMMGMTSPTVERLEHLGLVHPKAKEDRTMRRRMTFGNRLFQAQPDQGFQQTAFNDSIARSGWSWGAAAFDFDNDGFPDVYVANGQESKQSVREYEPEFWLRDIYVDDSVDDLTATAYFTDKFSRTRGEGWSYGGYDKNRLFLNQNGRSFNEIGFLMGVALEEDSRNVVADDLDGDGRVDLLVTTLEVWPEMKQTLKVYRNELSDAGHWIGFRFREGGSGESPVGIQVSLNCDGRNVVQNVVTGDSFRSQRATSVHFGLGQATRVESVEIRWPNGRTLTLREPAIDHYHAVHAPEPVAPRPLN